VAEGQNVIAIQSCQHIFHDKCILPWILENGSCPTCRHRFWTAPNPTLIRLLLILEHQVLCDRKLLTWVICEGVLKKFPNAASYNAHKEQCEQVLSSLVINTIRILPIDLTNRASFKNAQSSSRTFLLRVHTDRNKQIHRWEETIEVRNSLHQYAETHPEFSMIWE
jgi:hypothetical protein